MDTTDCPRPIDRHFASYSNHYRHRINARIHLIAAPALLWSVVALLWCVPAGGAWLNNGIWAALAMFAAWSFYNHLSRSLGLGMLTVLFFFGCLCRLVESRWHLSGLLIVAANVLLIAWLAQCLGHRLEKRNPRCLANAADLLIGPFWILAKVYRQMGWRY